MNTQSLRNSKAAKEGLQRVTGTVHFMDGTRLVLQWPRQAGDNANDIAMNVRKALDADRILAHVDGSLMVIPVRNIKYIHITPAPEVLPPEVLTGATLLD